MPLATIVLPGHKILTNATGEFSVSLDPGTHKILITHTGYQPLEQTVTLHAGETRSVQFLMIRNEGLNDVVVLGSRSEIHRSRLNTTVPIDVLLSKHLEHTYQPSLIQMMNYAVPSINTSRQHLTDPITLRGLSPDHLLILLNGNRYHGRAGINPGSIRGTLGRGSVTNDLNSIPFAALEKIEILRDGASAQYGSDAIAGVMNIELKKSTGKTSLNLHLGQQYKGDGETMTFGANHGIPLYREKGFLNISAELRHRKPTYRGGSYLGTVYKNFPPGSSLADSLKTIAADDSIIIARGFSRKTPVSNDGSVKLSSAGLLVNGGYPINNRIELFWTGLLNYRHPVVIGQYRFPKNPNQVDTFIFPDGFKPKIVLNTWDISGNMGARGRTENGWNWKFGSVYGRNSTISYLKNTNNASRYLFRDDPKTEFYCGTGYYIQQINGLSFSKNFGGKIRGIKTFNIGFGAEHRFEKYRTKAGEEASWQSYDSFKRDPGSQPSPGTRPEDIVNESRNIGGLYADVESDVNDHLLFNLAGRYEHFSGFGNNVSGKLAIRYQFNSRIVLRGSVSNAYHAPALQQMYFTSILTSISRNGPSSPVRIGTFTNTSAVARDFGVKPLQPEKAINASGGITSNILPNINLTVDAFWIQIRDRIVLSGAFDRRSNPEVNRILQNFPDIQQAQFVTNAINTTTRGIEVVINSNWKIRKASIDVMLAATVNKTNLFGGIQVADKLKVDSLNTNTLFNREEREKIENGQPGSKIILSSRLQMRRFGLLIRNTRFGHTSAVFNSADPSTDEFFSAKILSDVSLTYSAAKWITLTAGANNVFNVYPDGVVHDANKNAGILIYSNEAAPFGYNGGYYFVSMAFSF